MVRVPIRLIIPGVLLLCCIGAYMQTSSLFPIWVMLGFALLGFFAKKLDFSFVTFLIGFVIGPSAELTFRQSLQLLDHDWRNLAGHPIALVFMALTLVTIVVLARGRTRTAEGGSDTREHNHEGRIS